MENQTTQNETVEQTTKKQWVKPEMEVLDVNGSFGPASDGSGSGPSPKS